MSILSYPHKGNGKNKDKHFNSNAHEEKLCSKERKVIRFIFASWNEWELQKVKSVQTESVFFMILFFSFKRISWRNECETLQITISCEKVPLLPKLLTASSWRRTGLYALERQSFWFICYGQEEDNGRNSRTLATEKFESHEASNGTWSKLYRCSHFFTILCLAISSRWTWNLLWSWNLPATNPKK